MTRRTLRLRRGRGRRRATAIVEFAVVLPLLITLLLGVIEYGWLFLVRQTLQNAAREGCRQKVLQTSVPPFTAAQNRVDAIMTPAGIGGYTTSMATDGCFESVTVTVPKSSVSLAAGFFGTSTSNLVGTTTMRKEGCVGGGP